MFISPVWVSCWSTPVEWICFPRADLVFALCADYTMGFDESLPYSSARTHSERVSQFH